MNNNYYKKENYNNKFIIKKDCTMHSIREIECFLCNLSKMIKTYKIYKLLK